MSESTDIYQYNRGSWDQAARERQRWSTPVTSEELSRARGGDVQIVLTPQRKVPHDWLGELQDRDVLLLAGSGGQQAPLIAAAGANVTVLDISPGQLALDRMVADREDLNLHTVEGSMDDLSNLDSDSFDLIVHPCSNTFVPSVLPVWKEAYRVLRPGGELISGFLNPVFFVFDEEMLNQGSLDACNRVPYSDLEQMKPERLAKLQSENEPLCFGHTLEDQLGGQMRAGFVMVDLYEDKWGPGDYEKLDQHLATFLATRCRKL